MENGSCVSSVFVWSDVTFSVSGPSNRPIHQTNDMFLNTSENRLRSGWRILLFLFLFWSLSITVLLVKPLFGEITKREFLTYYSPVIVGILGLVATVSVFLARRYLDKRSFISLGLGGGARALRDSLFGFGLSGAMAGTFLLMTLGLGLVEIRSVGTVFEDTQGSLNTYGPLMQSLGWGALGILFLEHTLVGYWEELVFRGYLFRNMTEGMGLGLSIAISCALYGLIHATNPNAGLLSTGIIVLFGFLRIYGLLLTRFLWLSIGMHIGWNFFQGPVFGFGASGHQKPSLMVLNLTGPDYLSGGAFGPEGSVLIVPVLILALLSMRWWAGRESKASSISLA